MKSFTENGKRAIVCRSAIIMAATIGPVPIVDALLFWLAIAHSMMSCSLLSSTVRFHTTFCRRNSCHIKSQGDNDLFGSHSECDNRSGQFRCKTRLRGGRAPFFSSPPPPPNEIPEGERRKSLRNSYPLLSLSFRYEAACVHEGQLHALTEVGCATTLIP